MQITIQSTHGFGARAGVKLLVYSKAGRGKTMLCATAPTPIILSAESGLLVLARYNLPYINVGSIADLRDAYAWARNSAEARQFETICIDSISEIAEVLLSAERAKSKDPRQAYGAMIDEMTKVVKDLRDLPGKNVYMSCKEENVQDVAGVVRAGPSMPGKKLGEAMPYFPDEVFKLDIEGTGAASYRYLRCQPDYANEAKDRSGVLDEREPPDLGHIIAKIKGAGLA